MLLRCRSLSHAFGESPRSQMLLSDLELQLEAGESAAVLGPSGSGKTTLLNLIAGLLSPDAGEIWLEDHPIHLMSEEERTWLRRRRLGMVFQFFNLVPTLSVEENLFLPLELADLLSLSSEVPRLLEVLGLSARRNAFPEQLSGGEQQRVAMARALIHQPALVLADEPTGSLDGATAERVTAQLFEELEARHQSLILVTHNPRLARHCRHCFRLEAGRLVPEG